MAFNVRVYGILIDEKKGILLSRELIKGKEYVKFPGGGLEIGEGTREGLAREFKEELDLDVAIGEHLYTTDFFQESAFKPGDQIISIYYYVHPMEALRESYTHINPQLRLSGATPQADMETFSFLPMARFSEQSVDLPIDKVVARMLTQGFVAATPHETKK